MTPHQASVSSSPRVLRSQGLTLVEVVVVLGILTMLLAFSGPALFSWMERADLKRATRNLVSTLQFARVQAIKENRTTEVRIKPDGWSVVRQPDGTELRSFSLSSLRSPVEPNSTITIGFRGNGQPAVANKSLELSSSGGKKFKISVSSAGRIKVE